MIKEFILGFIFGIEIKIPIFSAVLMFLLKIEAYRDGFYSIFCTFSYFFIFLNFQLHFKISFLFYSYYKRGMYKYGKVALYVTIFPKFDATLKSLSDFNPNSIGVLFYSIYISRNAVAAALSFRIRRARCP